jgi:hypothetical protein
MKSVLTAFRLILQTIAVWIYPALLTAGLLERITMADHAEVDVPSPCNGDGRLHHPGKRQGIVLIC